MATATAAGSFSTWYRAADMDVFRFEGFLVELLSCCGVWQIFLFVPLLHQCYEQTRWATSAHLMQQANTFKTANHRNKKVTFDQQNRKTEHVYDPSAIST
jgi:hypothetical protein